MIAEVTPEELAKRYRCSEHGLLPEREQTCPYCDKCPHGITRYGQCKQCNDFNWIDDPVTKKEFLRVLADCGRVQGPLRNSPYPRQFTSTNLTTKTLIEYGKERGWL